MTLFLLSSLLTELLTTNFTASSLFFQPELFLLFATVVYGFPILVIREIAVRKNFGLVGLFFLGLIYGLYNEALVAKTVFHPFHSPISSFATYGLIGNIRIPWALAISFWHALHSVIYPIIFVHYLFPSRAQKSWISKKTAWILGAVSLTFGLLNFFRPSQGPGGNLIHFSFILASWVFLWWLSGRVSGTPKILPENKIAFGWKIPCVGIALFFILFVAPFIFSELALNPVAFFIYFAFITGAGLYKLSKVQRISLGRMVLVAIGAEVSVAFFAILTALPSGGTEKIISSSVFIIIFTAAALRLRKIFNKGLPSI